MRTLVVDPGSQIVGWALFSGTMLAGHGTIKAAGKDIKSRLVSIGRQFDLLFTLGIIKDVTRLAIERLNYKTHYYCMWSVGTIIGAIGEHCPLFTEKVDVASWKSYNGLKQADKGDKVNRLFAKLYPKETCMSDDEREAVLMGRYVVNSNLK